MNLKAIIREYALEIFVAVAGIIALLSGGCQSWHYQRWEVVNDKVVKVADVRGSSWIMKSNVDNLLVKVDGEKRYMSIGQVNFDPDEEATAAFVEGIVAGVGKVLLP